MMLRHPSRTSLQEWLTGGAESELDAHLEACDRCADLLEELETATVATEAETTGIGDALAEALAAPEGLTQRLEEGVNAKLSSRQVMNVVGDLFAAGFVTTRLLLTEDTDDDN